MSPEELASHLPEWVIPEGTDLAQLRSATEQLIAEFSRTIRQVHQPASLSSSWSYTTGGRLDSAKWLYPHNGVPRIYICNTAALLRDEFEFLRVMEEVRPYGSWVCEDSLLEVFSDAKIARLSICTRRAIRREWLKLLKEKLNECQ